MARLAAKFSPWGAKAAKIFDPMKAASKAAGKAFEKAANLKQAAEGMKGFSQGMATAVGAPVKKMMEFEDIMAKVRANTFNGVVTAQTQAEFKQLGETARKLGADTKFSGVEAAEGLDILATAGFSAKGQMAALPGVLDLAAASNESIADSAEIAASAMAQFGLEADQMGTIGDVIAKTAQSSQTGLLDIGEALKYAGVSAKNAGVSIQATTAMIGALGDAGVKGSAAGTTLRSVLSSLQAPNKKGKSALDFLGINTKDKAGNMRPIEQILAEMDAAMDKRFGKDKNGNRRANLLKGLFDEANAANASLLIAKAGSGDLQAKISENVGAAGTAAKVAADMGNTTAGSARELDSALEELQLSVGELLIPTVREFVDLAKGLTEDLTSWAKAHPDLVKGIGLAAGALTVMGVGLWAVTTAAGVCATTWGVLRTAWGLAQGAGLLLTKGLNLMKVALLTNPITAILVGVATAAYLIYENWEPIKEFFIGVWDTVTSGAKTAFEWILDKINWIGEAIEDFRVSVMTEEEAAEYTLNKQLEFEVTKKNSSLFDDDLDTSSTGRKSSGQGSFDAEAERRNAAQVVKEAKDFFKPSAPALAGIPVGVPSGPEIPGLDPQAQASLAAMQQQFNGDLKITIDSEGQVKGTNLKTKGTPFQVRVNTGAQ